MRALTGDAAAIVEAARRDFTMDTDNEGGLNYFQNARKACLSLVSRAAAMVTR